MSDVLRWRVVVNRKACKCALCNRIIPSKSKMISAAWADGGTVYSDKFCLVCESYWRSELYGEELDFNGEPIYGDDFETWEAIRRKLEELPTGR